LSADLSKAYELLGVKPGVSNRELKAAHRDLAKVWHPDRFLHDPRLQEKAQEKLKEINEAYDLLISGKTPRSAPSPPPPPSYKVHYAEVEVAVPRKKSNWQRMAVPVMLFLAVFAVATRVLLQRVHRPLREDEAVVEEPAKLVDDHSAQRDSNARAEANDVSRKENKEDLSPEVMPVETQTTEPVPAVATVTVLIDPESGLRARESCRLRSRMTYPSGSEPSGYCNLVHTPPPKDSKIKSITKWLGANKDGETKQNP
jgi:hypothetical protein